MDTKTKLILRWAGSIIFVSVAFILAGIGSLLIAKQFDLWEKAFMGVCCAFTVVLSAYWSAPKYKLKSAIVWFLVGAVVSGIELHDAVYPEGFAKAYEPTLWPLVFTYAGGIAGLVFLGLIARRK